MAHFSLAKLLLIRPLIVRFFTSSIIGFRPKLVVIIALLYILNPLDIVPDVIPVVGWIEDIIIAILTFRYASGKMKEEKKVVSKGQEGAITVDAKVIEEE